MSRRILVESLFAGAVSTVALSSLMGCRAAYPIGEANVAQMRVFSEEGKRWLVTVLDDVHQKPDNHIVSVEISPEDFQIRVLDRSSDEHAIHCIRRVWYPFAPGDEKQYYSVPIDTFGPRFAQIYEMCATRANCRDAKYLTESSNPYVYYVMTTGDRDGFIADECGGAESAVRAAVVAWDWRDEGPPYTLPATWDSLVRHDCVSFASLATAMVHAFDEMCRVYAEIEARGEAATDTDEHGRALTAR